MGPPQHLSSHHEVPQGWPCCHHHPWQVCRQEGGHHPAPRQRQQASPLRPRRCCWHRALPREDHPPHVQGPPGEALEIKPFIKVINYNHLMPTRYTLELEGLKGTISADTFKEVSQREDAKKTVKKVLEERYTSGKNRWFFTPLRF